MLQRIVKGWCPIRSVKVDASGGESVMVYSDSASVVLQVRRLVHGSDDPLAASFKSGVCLDRLQAVRVAQELLRAAADVREE